MTTEFAESFPGHAVVDLTREHLNRYMGAHARLSPKSRNDRRAAVKMFARWCVRQDFLTGSHRLFQADNMALENGDPENIEFFSPNELRRLLDHSEGPMRAMIVLQGLGGLRVEEVCRLDWMDVFRIPGPGYRQQDPATASGGDLLQPGGLA